jgi:hypothetical protein
MSDCFHECPICNAIHSHVFSASNLSGIDDYFKPCQRQSCKVKFAERKERIAEREQRRRESMMRMKVAGI